MKMQTKLKTQQQEEYKQTELGLLPKEWEVVRLGEIVKYYLGRTPPRKEKKFWENGTFPWVNIADMKKNYIIFSTKERITEEALKKYFINRISKRGTLLMSFKLTIGRTAFLGIDATHNEAIISIYPKKNCDKHFLFYYLPIVDYFKYMDKAVKGNTLNKSKINKILIPLPPLQEQKAIAFVLSTIQTAKEKTEQVIQAIKELKKSLMKHLFTYGPVSLKDAEKVKLKETEIGKIPEGWEVVGFENCIIKKRIQVAKIKQQQYKKIGKYPIVDQGRNLIAGYWDDKKDVYQEDLPVIVFGDHTRIIKFVDFPFVAGADGTKIIIPDKSKTYPLFFYYALLTLNIPSRGYNRHYSLLKEKKIPLPPLQTQKKIASILSAVDEKIEKEENKKKALEELFKSMLYNLMSAKIRVKDLVVENE